MSNPASAALWLALSVAAMVGLGSAVAGDSRGLQQPGAHFEGEYGLWVNEDAELVEVHWMTRSAGAGFLRVLAADTVRYGFTTPVAFFHEATFPKLYGDEVTIQYGASADAEDQHITVLQLYDGGRPREPTEIEGVDSLYVVGDVHGEYMTLTRLLANAGLVDEALHWSGGGRHVVLLGDIFDRGLDVTRTLWFLYRLEREAEATGGGVHIVLGNHELMAMANDLRYVTAKEKLIAEYYGTSYPRLFDTRLSVLGKWLASKVGALKVDDVVLVHGGISSAYSDYTLREINDTLAAYFAEDLFRAWSDSLAPLPPLDSAAITRRTAFFFDANSIFWYRGYVRSDTLEQELTQMLERHAGDLHVVAHTRVPTIQERYGGSLVAVDVDDTASEMLLLVRDGSGYARYRLGLKGGPQRLTARDSSLRR